MAAALCAMAVATQRADAATAMPNLVVNGDFSQGAVGFQTDYALASGAGNSMSPAGDYYIGDNPNALHSHWVSMSGTTMMMVNGADTAGAVVWEEGDFKPEGGSLYTFSGQATDLCCGKESYVYSPADLVFQFSTNGGQSFTTVAQLVTHDGDAGQWQTISGTFYVGPDSDLDVRILDLNTAEKGNDFAITDLSLVDPPGVPEPATWATMMLGLGLVGAAMRQRAKREVCRAALS